MYICKYCKKEFDSKQKLAGHVTFCKHNPNYLDNINKLKENRKNINYNNFKNNNKQYICKYCGKIINNKGCLVLHERSCINNPNRIITEKQLKLKEQKQNKQPKKLSEEHKRKIKESLIKWRKLNYEKFLQYSRQKSQCCENFKKMLKLKNINFIEEYSPFIPNKLYSLDIAFPDIKIGIEINGSQHYNKDGSLNQYTLEKQKYFEDRGWKIFQIFYKLCYNINIENFNDILNLPIYNKNYIKEFFDKKEEYNKIKENKKLEKINLRNIEKNKIYNYRRNILIQSIENTNIDFSKSWTKHIKLYLENNNLLWDKCIFRCFKKYYPEFLEKNDIWIRKSSTKN